MTVQLLPGANRRGEMELEMIRIRRGFGSRKGYNHDGESGVRSF